jgi:hypothetical protein
LKWTVSSTTWVNVPLNLPLIKFWFDSLLLPWRIRLLACAHSQLINSGIWILQTVGRTPWTGDQPCRKAAIYDGQYKHKMRADSMPLVVFEPTISLFEQRKTLYALHRAATVVGLTFYYLWL